MTGKELLSVLTLGYRTSEYCKDTRHLRDLNSSFSEMKVMACISV